MELRNGEVALIADQPTPGLTQCASAIWSHDGRRILFDATPGTRWNLTRLKSIELGEGRPHLTDLGFGNCPSLSPSDDQIAFLSNADGGQNGLWLMNRGRLGTPTARQLRKTHVVTGRTTAHGREL
jgi:hypothetical protein